MDVLKQAYDLMSEEEKYEALFHDPLTAVFNRRAFETIEAAKPISSTHIAIIDLDSLKWVNDNLGHRRGDTMLVAVAVALCEQELEVYRLSGDEFAVRGSTYSLYRKVGRVQNILELISVGFGPNLEYADEMLRDDKMNRERKGLRSPRGVCPPWMKVEEKVEEHHK